MGPARSFPIPSCTDRAHRNSVDFFHCDKYAFKGKTILFWLAKAWVPTGKSHVFENSVQQGSFFQIEASHFAVCKFQAASHSTEVRFFTNDRPGEPSIGNCEENLWNLFSVVLLCFEMIHTLIDSKLNRFVQQCNHFGL